MRGFNYSAFKVCVYANITRHYRSFVGRDFKAWAHMALFIIGPYLNEGEASVWLSLSKVHYYVQYKLQMERQSLFIVLYTSEMSLLPLYCRCSKIAYCQDCNPRQREECQAVCHDFVSTV